MWYIVLNKVQDAGRFAISKNSADLLPHDSGQLAGERVAERAG